MPLILRIALDTPLRRLFDYLAPPDVTAEQLVPGVRVRVPFGKRRMVGVLVETVTHSELPLGKLKAALELIDSVPVLDPALLECVLWAADYYHHPAGEVFAAALPKSVRAGKPIPALVSPAPGTLPEWAAQPGPELTAAQAEVLTVLSANIDKFGSHLLYGVTGSGKTEVYLRIVEQTLTLGRQALVLVPEIALTPQLVSRFQERFSAPIAVLHSGLTDAGRFKAWQKSRNGEVAIVIGTRSAVFTPLARPGVIVVDEEHDASYKQQEGFRYSARDLAVARAQRHGIPVLLGSATPSLETIENARAGRYSRLVLPERPGEARHPHVRLVDLRKNAAEAGLSTPALTGIDAHLKEGGQVLVYLNRRGFAPVLFCPGCGWVAPCMQCDARLTVHMRTQILRCHHCGSEQRLPLGCPSCGHEVKPVGQGTERVEQTLQDMFPHVGMVRFDRDTVKGRGEMEAALERVNSGEARILVGTQMLTKGHHFPDVTLVVVVNADQGLFSSDFRASERLAQTIIQVSGRAGRANKPGEVLIQSEFPEHPLLQSLLTDGYDGFADTALKERASAQWPPFSRLTLLRASSEKPDAALQFLEAAGAAADPAPTNIRILGPVTATMARRAGHHHAQLLLESSSRAALHRFLSTWLPKVDALRENSRLRWSVDVDPADLY